MPGADYRDPLTVRKLVTRTNELGELDLADPENWQTHCILFGQVIVKGTREFQRAGITAADVTHLVRVPFYAATQQITCEMRIELHATGETMVVRDAYRRDDSNREIEILCGV